MFSLRALSRSLVLLGVLGVLAGAGPLAGQTATLVRDLNTNSDTAASPFEKLTAVQGNLFFLTTGIYQGKELWVSDGTGAGTRALLDPCPGSCSMTLRGSLGKILFFGVDRGFPPGVAQLWRSDGSRSGTFRLAPDAGLTDSIIFNGAFYFVGCTTAEGCDLWRSDGSQAGTVRVKDVGPGNAGKLIAAGNRLFFPVSDSGDVSLWSSDGTAAGTSRIKAVGHGLAGALTAAGPRLYFMLTSDSQKTDLWTSDGTAAGTLAVKQFRPTFFSAPLETVGGRVYFAADDGVYGQELWTSDGTPAGTRRISGFGLDNTSIAPIRAIGNRVVFVASDGLHGNQIWTTTGTLDSTAALPAPPCTECDFVDGSTPFAAAGNVLVFPGRDDVHGSEPWVTDGTAQGTHLLADLCPGACDSIGPYNRSLTPTSQGLLFAARGPNESENLWRTDGTAAGTMRLSDLGPSAQLMADITVFPSRLETAVIGSTIYFGAFTASGPALWVTNGHASAHRAVVVSPQGPSSVPAFLTPYGDRLLFFTTGEDSPETLWITRGTEESTVEAGLTLSRIDHLFEAEAVQSGGLVFYRLGTSREGQPLLRTDGTAAGFLVLAPEVEPGLAVYHGRVFFTPANTANAEIWSTDGTTAGTRKEFTLPAGTPTIRRLTALGADLYFITGDFDGGKVWRSDGTLAGTQPLADLPPIFLDDYAPGFTRIGSRVLFVAPDSLVWTTDGTPAGTRPLESGTEPVGEAYDLTLFNGAVYFFGATPTKRGLFRSDGTPAGTAFVTPVYGFTFNSLPASTLIAGAGRLWFAAADTDHGTELWTSDGTAAGTAMVKDILPGTDGSSPAWLAFAGGRLFFAATDGGHGTELWQSDGTAAGTRMVQDIASLASSSYPDHLTAAGDRLYFAANDGPTGRELWSLPLSDPAGCQPSATALCLGGRYRVEARWRDFQAHTGTAHVSPLTADTGTFWFFDPSNVEAIVKVLDGRSVNGHIWVFYGALSNVEYTLTVTDTQTGFTRQYFNPAGQFASVGDTRGFGPLGANGANPHPPATVAASSPLPLISETIGKAATAPCQATAQRLCLNGGRFAVEVAWKDFQNHTGQGNVRTLTGDTGAFWFFGATNIELVVKLLDGHPVNGHFWLFYGALSNVEYTVTVTDTQTGTMKTYKNPSGRFASVADTEAF
jgi:ELWxxDGT repeat protein